MTNNIENRLFIISYYRKFLIINNVSDKWIYKNFIFNNDNDIENIL